MVAAPAEQVISRITNVEHVMSVSRPGLAVITVQFKVGVPRITALVSLYDTILSNQDWLPRNLGTLQPIIKPKGIDDVPIVTLALFSKDPAVGPADLEQVAHAIETDLKRVPGTREVETQGGPRRAVNVRLDPARMNAAGVTVSELRAALLSANNGAPIGEITADNRAVLVDAGPFFRDARDVGTPDRRDARRRARVPRAGGDARRRSAAARAVRVVRHGGQGRARVPGRRAERHEEARAERRRRRRRADRARRPACATR